MIKFLLAAIIGLTQACEKSKDQNSLRSKGVSLLSSEDIVFTINEDSSDSFELPVTISDASAVLIGVPSDENILKASNISFELTPTVGQSNSFRPVLTLTPETNKFGTVTIEIQSQENSQNTPLGSISVKITPVNDPPQFSNIIYQTVHSQFDSSQLDGYSQTNTIPFVENISEATIIELNASPGPGEEGGAAITDITNYDVNVFTIEKTGPKSLSLLPAANSSGTHTISLLLVDELGAATTVELQALFVPLVTEAADSLGTESSDSNANGDSQAASTDDSTNSSLESSSTDSGAADDTPNTAPSLSNISDLMIQMNQSTPPLRFTLTDAEQELDCETHVIAFGNNSLLIPSPDTQIQIMKAGADCQVVVIPAKANHGRVVITLLANDGNGGEARETFALRVNGPPTISPIQNPEVIPVGGTTQSKLFIEDPETNLDCSSSFISIQVSNSTLINSPDSQVVIGTSGTSCLVSVTPQAGVVGTSDVTITVTDSDGASASSVFTVEVNEPPQISNLVAPGVILMNQRSDKITFELSDSTQNLTCDSAITVSAASNGLIQDVENQVSIGGTAPYCHIYIRPDANTEGNETITITADDSTGVNATAEESFPIAVQRLKMIQSFSTSSGSVGVSAVYGIAVSPDGKHVYQLSNSSDSINTYNRDGFTGQINLAQTLFDDGQTNGTINGLDGAYFVEVAPDGSQVYVLSAQDAALTVFNRNATSGSLTHAETLVDGAADGAKTIDGLATPRELAVSPDGKHIYTVSNDSGGAIAVFKHELGDISFVEVIIDGNAGANNLANAYSVEVSPDGGFVYVGSYGDDAITVFSRNSTDGTLTYQSQARDADDPGRLLDGISDIKIDTKGEHLYAASTRDAAITLFSIDQSTGALTYQSHYSNSAVISNLFELIISPQDDYLYGATEASNMGMFLLDPNDGSISHLSTFTDGSDGFKYFDSTYNAAISPDGSFLYVPSTSYSSLHVIAARPAGGIGLDDVLLPEDNNTDAMEGFTRMAVSPDGKHLYGLAANRNALLTFDRALSSGQLVQQGGTLFDGVNGVDGLAVPKAAALSANGANLYVAAQTDSSVAVFSRDGVTGALSYVEVHKDDENGVDGLDLAVDVAVSPDDSHVYAVGYGDRSIAIFSRDSGNGTLTYVDQVQEGVGGVTGLKSLRRITFSPDGLNLYAVGGSNLSGNDSGITTFSRNTSTGALTYRNFIADDLDGGIVDGLANSKGVVVSPDGRFVYVAGASDDMISLFSRDPANNGELTHLGVTQQGSGGVDGLWHVHDITMSSDGASLYAAAFLDNSITHFSSNVQTGALTYVAKFNDSDGSMGLRQSRVVVLSPDGFNLYTSGQEASNISIFQRN